MGAAALVEDTLGRAFNMARQATRDLTPEELLRPPKPHIAWLTWHMARVQDANFAGLLAREQLWLREAWHARFNMPANPRDYGSGHRQTPAQVDAFTVSDKQLIYDYMDAVFDQTRTYLATVADQDLSRVLNEPRYQPLPTLSIRFASVITCNTRHAGQIEYLRGLIKQGGWFPALEK